MRNMLTEFEHLVNESLKEPPSEQMTSKSENALSAIQSDSDENESSVIESYKYRRKIRAHYVYHEPTSPQPSASLLSSFGLIEQKNIHKFKKYAGATSYYNMNFSSRRFFKKSDDMTRVYEPIDESKLDVNLPLVDQLLLSRQSLSTNKSDTSDQKYSRIDLNLKYYMNSSQNDSLGSVISPPVVSLQDTNRKLKRRKERISSQEALIRAAANLVDVNAFQHVLLHLKQLKHQSTCHQLSIGNKPFNIGKLEFIYGQDNYWMVKLKKVFASESNTLYQMKCVRSATNNGATMPIKSASSESQNQRPVLLGDSISIDTMPNLNWLFSVASHRLNSNSYLSNKVVNCLKPPGWSKQNGRVFKQLDYSKINNDLVKLLRTLNCYDTKREENDQDENDSEHKAAVAASNKMSSLDMFKENTVCELIWSQTDESMKPICVYIVTIMINIAGRLLIEIKENEKSRQFWLFYTDRRLRPLGWAKYNHYNYINYDQKEHILPELSNAPIRQHFVSNRLSTISESAANPNNCFKINYYLECLYENKFYVGRVVDESENNYFRIKLETTKSICLTFLYNHGNISQIKSDITANGSVDSSDSDLFESVIFTSSFHTLFPCKWCSSHNIRIEPPPDWPHTGEQFDWDSYYEHVLKKQQPVDVNNNQAQPIHLTLADTDAHLFNWCKNLNNLADRFQLGMYLECASNSESNRIHLSQIKAKTGHLLFLYMLGESQEKLKIVSVDSSDIFPVGWCEMNNYYSRVCPEYTPRSVGFEIETRTNDIKLENLNPRFLKRLKGTKYWINSLQIRMDCYHGPYLRDSKLQKLPKSFGPGPIFSVIYKLLQTLINISEKPFKVIKLLQAPKRPMALYNPSLSNLELDKSKYMLRFRLRAKEKGKYIFKEVDMCTVASQLNEYLNQLCIQLGCCTRMFSFDAGHFSNSHQSMPLDEQSESQLYLEKKCCEFCSINHFCEEKIIEVESPIKKIVKPVEKATVLPVKRQYKPREKGNVVAGATTLMTTRRTMRLLEESQAYPSESVSSVMDHIPPSRPEKRRKRATPIDNYEPITKRSKPVDKNDRRSSSRIQSTNFETKTKSVSSSASTARHIDQMDSFLTIRSQCEPVAAVGLGGARSPGVVISNRINPIYWSISDVGKYLSENMTETNLVQMIRDQEIDGHSFLMLNMPTIQSCMNLKLGPAIKLTHLVEQLKQHYFTKFDPFQRHV